MTMAKLQKTSLEIDSCSSYMHKKRDRWALISALALKYTNDCY